MRKKILAAFALATATWAQSSTQTKLQRVGLEDVTFIVRLISPVSTQTLKAGDILTASVQEPSTYANGTIDAHVLSVKRSKTPKNGKAELELVFFRVTASEGQPVPVKANLKEFSNSKGNPGVGEDGTVINVASTKATVPLISRKKDRVIGTAIGAAVGGLPGVAIGAATAASLGPPLIGTKMTAEAADIELSVGSTFMLTVSEVPNRVTGGR